ncbi:MAG: hypothetical protein CK425_09745 [Parachlamydia sp.]|nr:MAG: hypothetical protein CK425_09745 [Parachlamydia sp.]
MNSLFKYLIIFFLINSPLNAVQIATFYGSLEVDEPVLLKLIESPSFQRLKYIHQYGVAYYTTHAEEYTRYDHSLGVFAILRLKNASLEEQIAGLLHDVSHTVFSHVGDWIFGKAHRECDYQTSVHSLFLERYGVGDILKKYHFTIEQILPLQHLFPRLEQKAPALCADRIEYNIQGACYQGFLSYAEAMELLADLQFIEGDWVSTNPVLMAKLARFSLMMTQQCWGSAANHLSSEWLAKAILRAVDLGHITFETIHFGIDQTVWDLLLHSADPMIQKLMRGVLETDSHFEFVDAAQADLIIKGKFRGIDPLILWRGKKTPLTQMDAVFCKDYQSVKEKMEKGWSVKIYEPLEILSESSK